MAVLLAAILGVTACGDDGELTSAEREWCSFAGATDEDAYRFDEIFEAGLGLRLNMDVVNALASRLRSEYEAEGMDASAAVAAVSDDLMENADFAAACRAAYVDRDEAG